MIEQLSAEERTAAGIMTCLDPAQGASTNLSNLRNLFCLAAGRRTSPLFQCGGATCPSLGMSHTKAGSEPTQPLQPGKQQLFLARASSWAQTHSQVCSEHLGLWHWPVQVFRYLPMWETSFCPRVNNGSGSLPWECLTATCRVLHLCKTCQNPAKCLRICGKVTQFYKTF